jgi:phosphatidate cytidylyltransferase
MKSLTKRLILTFTAVPALFSLIFFLPHYNHLGFAILTFLALLLGSYEINGILFTKEEKPIIPFYFCAFLPLIYYLEKIFLKTSLITIIYFFCLVLVAFCIEVFNGVKDDFENSLIKIAKTVFSFVYPPLFSLFLIEILFFKESTLLLLFLFLLVFGNDTFAYVFGMAFGKNNRNLFKVSPNKSLVGFIGGFLATMAISCLYVILIPTMSALFNCLQALLFGFVIALTSNIGDLAESLIKRSAKVKDSGHMILGRGGIPDSIDSLLASAPIFLLLVVLLT